MKSWRRQLWLFVVAGLLSPAFAAPAQASTDDCAVEGKKTPVLFVHGFKSDEGMWGDVKLKSSFVGKVDSTKGLAAKTFDYGQSSLRWVTDPNIGKALAERILCLAKSSREQGGPGKVIVVAHSMGGLATRQAVAEDPAVAGALGFVITIATPNKGSFIDRQALTLAENACRTDASMNCYGILGLAEQLFSSLPGLQEGSKELSALPKWPQNLPVFAFGGNIALHYNLFGYQFDGTHSGNDSLVRLDSALFGRSINGVGGTLEIRCSGGPPPLVVGWTHAPCEHSALAYSPLVQKVTVTQIEKYIAARKLPEACQGEAIYQGQGYTIHANTTVESGTVSCQAAVDVAKSYLEKEDTGSVTKVGRWECRTTSTSPGGGFVSECTGPEGKIRLDGE